MSLRPKVTEELTYSVIGAFYEVYNTLGFGFLEHIYKMALERELRSRGHQVAREVSVRVFYKGLELASQRLDMIVDGVLIVETKANFKLERRPPAIQLFESNQPGGRTVISLRTRPVVLPRQRPTQARTIIASYVIQSIFINSVVETQCVAGEDAR